MTPRVCLPTLGAVPTDEGFLFRVWAPKPRDVQLVIHGLDGDRRLPMEQDGEYWQLRINHVPAGSRYRYLLDGEGPFPDPCSRSQPEGVHGPSEVVDPRPYPWTDQTFTPPHVADLVLYELHIGTFTHEGTFAAAAAKLPYLRELGINAIEVMPIASFPGRWNWGYDGVSLFAPQAGYGGPEGFRRFVDAAHAQGLAVVLDVVYNHFGPDGNYTGLFSDAYLTPRRHTPWGDAINLDDRGSAEVRRFFCENLLHWVHEYHVDGFRFDATHAVFDESAVHILARFSELLEVCPRNGHVPYLIAETHQNDARYLRPRAEGGYGLDAVWADDFHHIVRNLIQAEQEGQRANYEGTGGELARVIEQGFFFEGQYDTSLGETRGTPARDRPWRQFVYCIQNHDQVGNRPFGDRLAGTASRADVLAATLLLLLLPQTPLLFQGQELLSTTPFLYFTDHHPELGRAITEGRRHEFHAFSAFSDENLEAKIPDPQDEATYRASQLQLDSARIGLGALAFDFHRELLRLRADDPVLRAARRERAPIHTVAGCRAVAMSVEAAGATRWLAVNFGPDQVLDLPGHPPETEVIIHSAEPRWGALGPAPRALPGAVDLPAHTAVFLKAP